VQGAGRAGGGRPGETPGTVRGAAGAAGGSHAGRSCTLKYMLVFLDYDGTLTTHECNEIVLQRFVGDAWRPLEAEAKADHMGHAECFDRQIGLVQAPRRELIGALVAEAEPEAGLQEFFAGFAERDARPVIVSAGLREAITTVWEHAELPPVELHASELVGGGAHGGPPYHLAFSDVLGDCPRCGPKACKGAALRALRRPGEPVLVFGDGASDLCPAREADLVFARDHLAVRCAAEGIEWRPLRDYAEVWPAADAFLAGR